MADLLANLAPTALVPAGSYGISRAGVTVSRLSPAGIASVAARRGQEHGFADACRAQLGLDPPGGPRAVAGTEVSFVGIGPNRWLALGTSIDLEERLRAVVAGTAAICGQTDAYVVFDVAGPQARAALAKGVAIDLDPSVFKAGDAATTSMALVGVTFWQVDEAPTYRFAVGRSFAPSFLRFLVASAAEFGCVVAESPPV